jgi:hypothetical protein
LVWGRMGGWEGVCGWGEMGCRSLPRLGTPPRFRQTPPPPAPRISPRCDGGEKNRAQSSRGNNNLRPSSSARPPRPQTAAYPSACLCRTPGAARGVPAAYPGGTGLPHRSAGYPQHTPAHGVPISIEFGSMPQNSRCGRRPGSVPGQQICRHRLGQQSRGLPVFRRHEFSELVPKSFLNYYVFAWAVSGMRFHRLLLAFRPTGFCSEGHARCP